MPREFRILLLEFRHCAGLPLAMGEGAQCVVDAISSIGGRILWFNEDTDAWESHPDPMQKMDDKGSFLVGFDVEHSKLGRSPFAHPSLRVLKPIGHLSYLRKDRQVSLSQSGFEKKPANLDRLAAGQLEVAKQFYPHFRPSYGYIDELGYNRASDKQVQNRELKYIYWANFFSPTFVNQVGLDFLLNAPGWRKEELDDGGLLFVVAESYFEWWSKPPQEILAYFRARIPDVKLYRAKRSSE